VEAAQRPKPWVGDEESKSPARAAQAKGNKALKARYSKAQGGGRAAAETLGRR